LDERTRDLETPLGPTPLGPPPREPAKDGLTPPLKAAIRRARVEEAEHSEVLAELRGAELARLEMLQEALEPVLAEVPQDVDLFDVGVTPGAHPRLFIDMIGFVEMGRDRRLYRFLQDTRHGRVKLAESEKIETMVKAVTDYIARRLVEREKALAADTMSEAAPQAAEPPVASALVASAPVAALATLPKTRKSRQDFRQILGFTIDLLGSMALFTLVAAGAYYLLTLFAAWSALHHH
jgi:hypothetical protein